MVDPTTFLDGIRVLEVADETAEYAGKLLAGLGADVVKVEPPGGEITRGYGPFLKDEPHPDRSLHFWHYNLGKRGIILDLDTAAGRSAYLALAARADVIVDGRPRGYLAERGVDEVAVRALNPAVIYSRTSAFGDSGPWADYRGSDLVHLALGGVMMNCGYDPDPDGRYDTPPIAPQMWQAYQIASEQTVAGVLTALTYRERTGVGQYLSTAVHDAVSKNTEIDVPSWVFLRQPHRRQTCRHSMPAISAPILSATRDGRWLIPYVTYLGGGTEVFAGLVRLLTRYDLQDDLAEPEYADPAYRSRPEVARHIAERFRTLINRFDYNHDIWREAQAEGLAWAPIRSPHENLADEHFAGRESFAEVEHPELGSTYIYVGAKWVAPGIPWRTGPRAPLLGEHTAEVLAEIAELPEPSVRRESSATVDSDVETPPTAPFGRVSPRDTGPVASPHGTPFALAGVRVIDLSWMLASAGAGRFLAAHGAEVIKVEHESRWDGMRWGVGIPPPGGRAQRRDATEPIPSPKITGPNRGGSFMEINAGKKGISLNLKHPEGREILIELLREADMVIEGFSPGTMKRMGFGYDRLREINPRIIYVQQSGLGEHGTHSGIRTYGPSAAGFAGISEMSGLPEPRPPAGIGYSYLDWFGAYNMANAMLAALLRRERTGLGCYVDTSQVETGLYLTGTAILDYTVNGRAWQRTGNRAAGKRGAPHGAYRVRGDDRWVALTCFTQDEWSAAAEVLGRADLIGDPSFATLDARIAHQDELDAEIGAAVVDHEPYELMAALQARGVPAGVCQTAGDRCDTDPQLAHLGWQVELPQSDIGVWPVKELAVKLSATPSHIGGPLTRSGPSYGEDNEQVYADLLGYDAAWIESLRADNVI